jgi:Contractile injection system tape measure protein
MPNSPHRIRQLRWQVSTTSAIDAFAIRQTLATQWQDLFLPALTQVFDEAVSDDAVIHIPKLELHLTVDTEQDWRERLPDLIRQQLQDQLQPLQQDQRLESVGRDRPSIEWQHTTPQHDQVDLLLHYLRIGSVPWQATHVSPPELAEMLRQTCQQQWQPLMDYLRHTSESAAFYFRLLQLLPETDWLPLVKTLLNPLPSAWGSAVIQVITEVLAPAQPLFNAYQQCQLAAAFLEESLRYRETHRLPDGRRILETVFGSAESQTLQTFMTALPGSAALLFHPHLPTPSSLSEATAEVLPEGRSHPESSHSTPLSPPEPDGISPIAKATHPIRAQRSEELAEEVAEEVPEGLTEGRLRPAPDSSPPALSSPAPDPIPVVNPISSDRERPPEPEMDVPPVWAIASSSPSSSPTFPLSVRYAGLVLLHPFISHFFAAVGVNTTGEKTLAVEAIPRAAALLHFLATGTEAIYEYELDLIKVLLGLAPDTPLLVADGLIQTGDREEATTLLQSVIQYWSALKNTSIAGLRSSFLQRPGLLRHAEDGWRLHVEPQAFDLLLNHLPWGISIVKLTWMPQPIYTEWLIP